MNLLETSPSTDRRGFAFYPTVPPISLELTNRCNLKCPYCANGTLTRRRGDIEWSLLEKIVGECAGGRHSIDWLHGTGEPLLWDRLEDVIRLIKSRDAGKASFATNATLLYADRVASLLAAGLRSIYVSLDSFSPDVYAATRGGDHVKVIRNIRTMIAMVPPDFDVTVALMNHKDQTVTAADRQLARVLFGPEERIRLNVIECSNPPSARADYRRFHVKVDQCHLPGEYFFIAIDGRVALCGADQDLLHVIGDTNRESIDEIWFKEANQITFRNIASGISRCPDVCTKRCHLKEPTIDAAPPASPTRPRFPFLP